MLVHITTVIEHPGMSFESIYHTCTHLIDFLYEGVTKRKYRKQSSIPKVTKLGQLKNHIKCDARTTNTRRVIQIK